MLFRLTFEIVYANGDTATVTTRPATDVAFERKFGATISSLFTTAPFDQVDDTRVMAKWFGENMRTEQTSFLAWHASRVGGDFDAWLDTVEEIRWNFASRVDPTPTVQPASSSASSPQPRASRSGTSTKRTTKTS